MNTPRTAPVITIDGPSASGKGTLARALAKRLNFYYLDTGAIYRALALDLLARGIDPDDADSCAAEARRFAPLFRPEMTETPDIRTDTVAQASSKSSRHPGVRAALLDLQRDLAHNPPAPFKGAVLDGRDTGTVVCPDAPLKLFLTANPAERAVRRTKELLSRGIPTTYEAVLQDLESRDARDSSRDVAPLRPAEDAAAVDTTDMDADAALDHVLSLVRARFPGLA
ncbi:MAG: (d)CMP kinase [Rhodospirillales bacterium]|nr:(d)CMP kinase [Alphaproteobacteria bacterium]MCB9986672.1 (d)CMP kinase [Rhodospirillales bacterium]USO06801.1 MAG: (d)CMP kinase [Rhodospirillales bacterium]